MTEAVGADLKSAREALGLSLSEVAHQLKLAPRQVEALEAGRFEALPGATFVRGMLRNYARLLKLEPEPLLESLSGRFEAPDANRLAARYSQPVPFSDNARRSTFVYLGLSLAVLTLGGGVAYQWYREHKAPAQLAAVTKRPLAKPAVPSASPPKSEPKRLESVAQAQVTAKVAAAIAPPPAPVVEKVAAVTAAPAPSMAPVVADKRGGASHRLVIRCEEEAWIEVKDANDRMLVSSLNPAGSERVVRSRGPLTLVIGNAAHVQVLHNDKPLDLAPHTKLSIARFTLP
jgi:cytoskeleton protein RodZ